MTSVAVTTAPFSSVTLPCKVPVTVCAGTTETESKTVGVAAARVRQRSFNEALPASMGVLLLGCQVVKLGHETTTDGLVPTHGRISRKHDSKELKLRTFRLSCEKSARFYNTAPTNKTKRTYHINNDG